MLYIAENLKSLRGQKGFTQEEAAEALGVSAQSVSKWERGENLPDIGMLPALANFYKTSVDELIGMDKINDFKAINAVFAEGHRLMAEGKNEEAAEIYAAALKIYPSDEGLMADLAMALALAGGKERLEQAAALCRRILTDRPPEKEKIQHTTRAALCFIYLKQSEKGKAADLAKNLPHKRESREVILGQMEESLTAAEIDSLLKIIAVGS